MEAESVGNGLKENNYRTMINVNSAMLTDDLTGVHNNYIRGFIYGQPLPEQP